MTFNLFMELKTRTRIYWCKKKKKTHA